MSRPHAPGDKSVDQRSVEWHDGHRAGEVECFGWCLETALRFADWAAMKVGEDAAKGLLHYARRVLAEGRRRYGERFDKEIRMRNIDLSKVPQAPETETA